MLNKSVFVVFCVVTFAFAQPRILNYQGKLTDSLGVALDGTYDLIFRIYDVPTGGTPLWSESHTGVSVHRGLFSVQLGTTTPLDVDFGDTLYLEIVVESEVLSPRIRLTGAPYSFRTGVADTALGVAPGAIHTDGVSLEGDGTTANPLAVKDGGITAEKLSDMGAVPGEVLKWNGSVWAPAADNVDDADHDATNELQTLSLSGANLTISSGNTVTFSGWDTDASNDITTSTSAGGDLSGTYPAPTVVGLQGNPVSSTAPGSGQVLTWNGSAWVPQEPAGNVGGAGTANYIPKWTGSTTLGNSQIYDNGSNVGIGTTSPMRKLEVQNGIFRIRNTGLNAAIELDGNTGATLRGWRITSVDDYPTGTLGNDTLYFTAFDEGVGDIHGIGNFNLLTMYYDLDALSGFARFSGSGDANLLYLDLENNRVGVGTDSPDPSAKFEINSTSGGFLPPRMTTSQRDAISSPATGLMIYNTTTGCIEFFGGTVWQKIKCGCTSPPPSPGEISGDTVVDAGDVGVVYSILPVSGAESYTWTVPADATIASGQGTTTITVNFGSSSGYITVTADNDCGSSAPESLYVEVTTYTPGADTFDYTGSEEQFVVPDYVDSIVIEAWGAQGGDNTYGGKGAYLKVKVAVTAGETLTVYAGGQGGWSDHGTPCYSGDGGDASYVARGNTPLVVAAGGGGAVYCSSGPEIYYGGDGSATQTPTSGDRSNTSYGWGSPGSGGGGGGAGSGSWGTGGGGGWYSAGGSGSGSTGGAARGRGSNGYQYAGGAGGGYNGAGGADMDSGWGIASCGGGGSYYSGTLINSTTGARTGNGMVIISW